MAEVKITSDASSFEENPFFIGQAQRLLEQLILKDGHPLWLDSYAEDLHLDSFNREFKCFYLNADDGYISADSDHERIFRALFEKAISTIDAMSYDQFISLLIEINELDQVYNTASPELLALEFLPSVDVINDRLYQKRNLSRVKGIFTSLLNIL